MSFFANLAYGVYLGPFPMIAVIGFATYAVILAAAILALGKRWSKQLRRIPFKVHRRMGLFAILLATIHLLMGISVYV